MSSDEEVAISYSGGFVAITLMKCFPTQNSIKARAMADTSVDWEESCFLAINR